MSNPQRRRWTAEEKLKVLEEARQVGQSVSEVCRRHQLPPRPVSSWGGQGAPGAVLWGEKAGRARRSGGPARRPAWPQGDRSHGAVPGRAHPAAGDRRRVEHREPATEKGALAVRPQRRYRPAEKARMLETVDQTQRLTGRAVREILGHLGGAAAP